MLPVCTHIQVEICDAPEAAGLTTNCQNAKENDRRCLLIKIKIALREMVNLHEKFFSVTPGEDLVKPPGILVTFLRRRIAKVP